jgi:hypothetical protein
MTPHSIDSDNNIAPIRLVKGIIVFILALSFANEKILGPPLVGGAISETLSSLSVSG